MSKQKNQWDGQFFPQEEHQELDEQALESVTGGSGSELASKFLNGLSQADRQEFEIRHTTGVGSQRGDELYSTWHQLYTGVTLERAQQIEADVNRRLAQHLRNNASSSK